MLPLLTAMLLPLCAGVQAEGQAPTTLAVVPVIAGVDDTHAAASNVASWVNTAVRELVGVRVLSDEELFTTARSDLVDQLRDCGPDAACLLTHLCSVDASSALLVGWNQLSNPPFLAMRLFDCRKRLMTGELNGVPSTEERDVRGAVTRRAREMLLRAGHALVGHIEVRTIPQDAQVSIDGLEARTSSTSILFRVTPGVHHLVATRTDHNSVERSITVTSGARERIELSLEPERDYGSYLLWGAVGVAAVAAGVVAAVILTSSPDTICLGGPDAVCE